MINHIIFYGTLMAKSGGRGVKDERLEYVNEVSFPGFMFNVGAFPAVVMGNGRVIGELYRFDSKDFDEIMQTYDMIEGYQGNKDGDLYTRTVVYVDEPGFLFDDVDTRIMYLLEGLESWVYTWNRSTKDLEFIPSGRWA